MERLSASLRVTVCGGEGGMRRDWGWLSRFPLMWLAWAVIVLAGAIALQVLASALDLNPLVRFGATLPLVGDALWLNGLLDLQWHLLVAIGLLPAGIVWLRDRHVRVDVIQARLPPRGQAVVDLIGNLVFAAPFLTLIVPAAWAFARRAWTLDEGSASGGLNDLWLVKSLLPLGLALLAVAIALETVRLARGLARR